jgi:hypothetical protein
MQQFLPYGADNTNDSVLGRGQNAAKVLFNGGVIDSTVSPYPV